LHILKEELYQASALTFHTIKFQSYEGNNTLGNFLTRCWKTAKKKSKTLIDAGLNDSNSVGVV